MAANPQRRAELADAGLRVLANSGARGLTHRAVDSEADVPKGTCSNYFKSRDELLNALADRILERLAPDPNQLQSLAGREPSLELMIEFLRYIHERTTEAPELTLALFELRLESSRRPDLAATLEATLSASYQSDVAFNAEVGLPGGPLEIALLHYAIEGFLFDQLTTRIDPDVDPDEIIEALARRLLAG